MKSPFWPRTFRGWLALQLARAAALVADVRFVSDSRYNVLLDSEWRQPLRGECQREGDSNG